jgi:hypothetical protein
LRRFWRPVLFARHRNPTPTCACLPRPDGSVRATASAVSSQLWPRGLFVPVLPQLCRPAGRGCSSGRGLGTSVCALQRSNPIVRLGSSAGSRRVSCSSIAVSGDFGPLAEHRPDRCGCFRARTTSRLGCRGLDEAGRAAGARSPGWWVV